MPSPRQYIVEGMTCDHCKLAVTEEVSEIRGVETVDVDLDSGRVIVTGDGFTDDAVKTAVEDAGYRLATEG